MFIIGLAMGPLDHYAYGWLNAVFPDRDLKTITKKILVDQLAMSPVCITSFFYGMGFLEGKSLGCMNKEIAHKFLEVYKVHKLFREAF